MSSFCADCKNSKAESYSLGYVLTCTRKPIPTTRNHVTGASVGLRYEFCSDVRTSEEHCKNYSPKLFAWVRQLIRALEG